MLEQIKNIKSGKSDLRKFGITIGLIILIISGFLFWNEIDLYKTLVILAVSFIVFGFSFPLILKPIYLAWMTFATILGWIMTRLILSILFFIIVTPIGLISRILKKRFLEVKFDPIKDSYWNQVRNENEKKKNCTIF